MKCVLILATQLQIWDGLITEVLVNNGIAEEGNPFIRSLVEQGGFLTLKILGSFLCVAALWILSKHAPRFSFVAASSLAAFYMAVLSWNFYVVFNVV
jgi:hypothetical protein